MSLNSTHTHNSMYYAVLISTSSFMPSFHLFSFWNDKANRHYMWIICILLKCVLMLNYSNCQSTKGEWDWADVQSSSFQDLLRWVHQWSHNERTQQHKDDIIGLCNVDFQSCGFQLMSDAPAPFQTLRLDFTSLQVSVPSDTISVSMIYGTERGTIPELIGRNIGHRTAKSPQTKALGKVHNSVCNFLNRSKLVTFG